MKITRFKHLSADINFRIFFWKKNLYIQTFAAVQYLDYNVRICLLKMIQSNKYAANC